MHIWGSGAREEIARSNSLICSVGCSQLPGLVAVRTRCDPRLGAINSHRRDRWRFPSLLGAGERQPRVSQCLFSFPMLSSFVLGQIYAVHYFPIRWFVNISVRLHKSTFPLPGQCRSKGERQLLCCPLKRQERDENGSSFVIERKLSTLCGMGHAGRGGPRTLSEVSRVPVREEPASLPGNNSL